MDLYKSLVKNEDNQYHFCSEVPFACHTNVFSCASNKKLKKYIRLHKFIKKKQNLLKKYKTYQTCTRLRTEKIRLTAELNLCHKSITTNNEKFINDTNVLNKQITNLKYSLYEMDKKYETAKNEISSHILAFNDLLSTCYENEQKFKSLMGHINNSNRMHMDENDEFCSSTIQKNSHTQDQTAEIEEEIHFRNSCLTHKNCNTSSVNPEIIKQVSSNVVLFTDQIGVGMGSTLQSCLTQKVINKCYPGNNFINIAKHLLREHSTNNTINILFIGNSLNVRKNDLTKLIDTLVSSYNNGTRKGNTMLCAFPYSKSLSAEQNQRIYYMNLLMYNLARHLNDIIFFDTNNFIKNFILTEDTLYLSYFYKKQIANLLGYNINSNLWNVKNTYDYSALSSCNVKHIKIVDNESLSFSKTQSLTVNPNYLN